MENDHDNYEYANGVSTQVSLFILSMIFLVVIVILSISTTLETIASIDISFLTRFISEYTIMESILPLYIVSMTVSSVFVGLYLLAHE